jgi:drug/metabolite transporter (DMT)-like permease
VTASRSAPVAALVAMVFIWGYGWVVMKIAVLYAHPFDFTALRTAIATALLFSLVKLRGLGLGMRSYRMAIVLGLLQVAVFSALTQTALLFAGPGKTSVLVYTMPFWLIVFAHFLIGERMRGAQWLAVALAFAGLVLIVAPWRLTSLAGSVLALAAGMAWALSAVLAKRWPVPGAPPLLYTAWQLLFGSIALGVLALAHPHAPIRWTREFVIVLGFCAVLASAMGWWLWMYVLSRMPAGIAGLNSLAIPVVAVGTSAIQLGERPSPVETAGMLLIGAALALLAALGLKRA